MGWGTEVARVRGLGSAKHGAHLWYMERLTSVTTFLLFVWLAVALLRLPSFDHRTVTQWLSDPLAAVPMLLLVVSTFWHSRLGLQVVLDDYVEDEGQRLFWSVLNAFFNILAGSLAFFSVCRIAFGGAA